MEKIKSATSAAKSVFLGGIVSKAVAFAGSVALARILVPEDYGYWVIVSMITSFFSLVVDAGFEYYYVVKVNINQGQETPPLQVKQIENSVFFLRVIVNIVLFILQFSFSFFPIPLLDGPIAGIIRILSFIHLINIFGRINEVRLKKRFDFRKTTLINVASEILSTVIKVGCALFGFGVFSFAWGGVSKVIFNNIGLIRVGKFKPEFEYVSTSVFRDVFHFSVYTWLATVGQYLSSQIDKFLLKSNFSMTQIGLYSFSNGTSQLFLSYLVVPQSTVIINYISNHQTNPKRIEELMGVVFNSIFIVVFPVQVILLIYAQDFIRLVYGEKWIASVELLQIFILYSLVELLFFPFAHVLTAFGKVKYRFILTYASFFTIGCVMSIGVHYSADIATYAALYVMSILLISIIKTVLSLKVARISVLNIVSQVQRTLLITLISFAIMCVCSLFVPDNLISKAAMILAFYIGFIAVNYFLNREQLLIILDKIRK